MDTVRDLTDEEEMVIYKAIDDFRECGKTNITCPVCGGKLNYTGNYSSCVISCEHCGVIYSIRGI